MQIVENYKAEIVSGWSYDSEAIILGLIGNQYCWVKEAGDRPETVEGRISSSEARRVTRRKPFHPLSIPCDHPHWVEVKCVHFNA